MVVMMLMGMRLRRMERNSLEEEEEGKERRRGRRMKERSQLSTAHTPIHSSLIVWTK